MVVGLVTIFLSLVLLAIGGRRRWLGLVLGSILASSSHACLWLVSSLPLSISLSHLHLEDRLDLS